MKKIIAVVLSLVMLLTCAAALAEAEAEQESLGVLKVPGAFDIRYSPLPDGYTINVYTQNDMMILANIYTPDPKLPGMGLRISFDDEWDGTERLNDVSDEDLEAIKDSFYIVADEMTFDIKETAAGTKLLTVLVAGGQDAYVYTIYKSHELEIQLVPGSEQDELTAADIDRVVAFLSDMQFVPIETAAAE